MIRITLTNAIAEIQPTAGAAALALAREYGHGWSTGDDGPWDAALADIAAGGDWTTNASAISAAMAEAESAYGYDRGLRPALSRTTGSGRVSWQVWETGAPYGAGALIEIHRPGGPGLRNDVVVIRAWLTGHTMRSGGVPAWTVSTVRVATDYPIETRHLRALLHAIGAVIPEVSAAAVLAAATMADEIPVLASLVERAAEEDAAWQAERAASDAALDAEMAERAVTPSPYGDAKD